MNPKKTFFMTGFILIGVILAWRLTQKPDEDQPQIPAVQTSDVVAQTAVEENQTQDQGRPAISSAKPVDPSMPTSAQGPRMRAGKRVAHLQAGEVGYSEEAGGIGIAGISHGRDGRVLLWDRFKQSFYLVDEFGVKEKVYELTAEDQYMKGATIGPNGEFTGLVGNTQLTLLRQEADGTIKRIPLPGEAQYLNAMRVEVHGDKTYIYGVDSTMEVNASGEVREFYGAPVAEGKQSLDIVLNEDRQAIITIRDQLGAPLQTRIDTQIYGAVQGIYPTENDRVVAVMDSDPFLNDFNRDNPHYTIHVMDNAGAVLSSFQIAHGQGVAIDQPISVSEETLYYSIQREGGELEVLEFPLNNP